jgi:cytochrome c oxidase subunit 1
MATTVAAPPYAVATEKKTSGLWSWLTTVDHKRIGQLYLYTALFWFLIGGIEAGFIRWQLRQPNAGFISAELYNQMFTMHGTTMISSRSCRCPLHSSTSSYRFRSAPATWPSRG